MSSLDSLRTLKTLEIDNKTYHYFSLPEAAKSLGDLDKLPMSLKVLLENRCAGKMPRPATAPTSRPLPPGSKSASLTARSSIAPPAC